MSESDERTRPSALWLAVPVASVAAIGIVSLLLDIALGEQPIDDVSHVLGELSWLAPVLILLQAAALVLRARFALATLVIVSVVDIALIAFSSGELSNGSVAVMIAAYSVRRYRPSQYSYILLAAVTAASATVGVLGLGAGAAVPESWVVIGGIARAALTYFVPALGAELVNAREKTVTALRERAELAELHTERSAREAVAQERGLMARELHDIAAHHLTGIIVSTQAADSLLTSDPERSREYVRTAGREAKNALENLRQTVGLLRTDGQVDLAPAPSIADIPALVAELRAAGMEVELIESGSGAQLGPIAEAAAYRMVQEALTNVRRHAPGAASTVLIEHAEGVTITVTNEKGGPSTGSGSGLGLLGMRERAALTGSTLETGPTAAGGWRVRLEVPPVDVS